MMHLAGFFSHSHLSHTHVETSEPDPGVCHLELKRSKGHVNTALMDLTLTAQNHLSTEGKGPNKDWKTLPCFCFKEEKKTLNTVAVALRLKRFSMKDGLKTQELIFQL